MPHLKPPLTILPTAKNSLEVSKTSADRTAYRFCVSRLWFGCSLQRRVAEASTHGLWYTTVSALLIKNTHLSLVLHDCCCETCTQSNACHINASRPHTGYHTHTHTSLIKDWATKHCTYIPPKQTHQATNRQPPSPPPLPNPQRHRHKT